MSTTPMIADHIVMKLPKEGRLSAAPAAVDAASVIIPPAALDPSAMSLFRTTGDSSPVIFCPSSVGDCPPPPTKNGGEEPPALFALTGAQGLPSRHFQRNRMISLIFCRPGRVAGFVSGFGPGREHQEGCLLTTPACGHRRPQFVSARFPNAREIRRTFHFQED